MKRILYVAGLVALGLVITGAELPRQPRPLLIDPTNGVPVSPSDFFQQNSNTIVAIAGGATSGDWASYPTNAFIGSLGGLATNLHVKGALYLYATPGTPGSLHKLVFQADDDPVLGVASDLTYSSLIASLARADASISTQAYSLTLTGTAWAPLTINDYWMVATNGKVGIGTNSPTSTLQVLGDFSIGDASANRITLNYAAGVSRIASVANGGWSLEVTHSAQPPIIFKTGYPTLSNRMVILGTNGFVGIATNYPTTELEVAGTVKASAFIGDGSGLTGITGGTGGGTNYSFNTSYFTVTNGTNVAIRGYEAVRNGAFLTTTTNWTAVTANIGVQSGGQAGNCLAITNTGAGNGSALQTFSTIPGVTYTVTGYFKNPDGMGYTGKILAPGGAFVDCEATDWTQYSVEFTALATESTIELINAQFDAPDSVVYFDSISVTGYHDLGRAQATEDWVLSRGYSTGGGGAGTVSNVAMRAGTMILMTGETNITTSGTNTVAVDTNALATFVQAEIDATTATLTNGPNVGVATNAAGDVYPYVPSGAGLTNITAMGYLRVGDSNNILAALNGMDWGFFDYAAERLDIGVYVESGQRILATGTDWTELNGPLLLMDTNLVDGELLRLDGNTVRSAGVAAADLITGIIVESNSVVIASNITRINFANPTTITSNAGIATVTLPTGGSGGGGAYQTVSNITASGTFGINVVPCTNTAGIHFNITLSDASTFDAPTNSVDGQIVRLRFIQNSTGGYTVATNGNATASWKFGTAITGFDITTNANAVSYVTMTYYAAGNTWHVIGTAPGY